MPLITSKRVWTQQPQYPASVASAYSSRAGAILLPSLGGAVANNGQTVTKSGSGYGVVPTQKGLGYTHNADNTVHASLPNSTLGTGVDVGGSLLCVFRTISSAGDGRLASYGSESGYSGNTVFSIGQNAGSLRITIGGSNVLEVFEYAASINDGNVHCSILTVNRFDAATRYHVTLDGRLLADTTNGGSLGSSNIYSSVFSGGWRRGGVNTASGVGQVLLVVPFCYGALSLKESIELSENPWQIFRASDRRIWIPSAGGGDVTITCTPGNATTEGITSGISSATTISCNTGTATTAGVLAVVSSATTIACNVGGASTAGVACALPIKIACNAGGATTAGVTTTFPQSISCNVGNATTAGVTAGIAGATTISCNVGNVSVAGITAGISSAITISCDAGTATTSGIAASFPQTLSCNVGNATTAGITAQVDIAGQIVIGCNAGTATTAGISANISSAVVLACNPGNATTLGATAYFPQSLQCTPGNAIALGIDATFTVTGPTTIVCNAGNAYAAGVSCDFGSRFDTPPDAIVAVINKRNRVSVISRRS